jgi:uncharacterized protein (TIGR03118 family)
VKKLVTIAASAALAISTGAVCFGQHYTQTNLDSSVAGAAEATDAQLVNGWGLARSSGGAWWVSDQATGLSTLYNGGGAKQSLVVTIPPADPSNRERPTGSPTGMVFNGSKTDFLLAPGRPAGFLFSTVDGTIAGWNPNVALEPRAAPPSTHAVTVVKTTGGSSYTGLTSALINGKLYLYAANFAAGRIDVYDSAFHSVRLREDDPDRRANEDDPFDCRNKPFVDEHLPYGYVPFNVQAIGNDIVVTYAFHQAGQRRETDGPGLGYVDIYSSTGHLLRRLEHGDWLNAPWGVTLAPLDFGRFSHDLLVGQFAGGGSTDSSGFIAAYDLATGRFDGRLQDANGKPLAINGIWALSPGNVSPANLDADDAPAAQLYFTAGPNQGSEGLFGYLTPVLAELTQGGGQ